MASLKGSQLLDWLKRLFWRQASGTTTVAPVSAQYALKCQGDEHVRAGRFADAQRCYQAVIDRDPHCPGALMMSGYALRELRRTGDAREMLERAVAIAPADADAHYLLGSVLETLGLRDKEMLHLEQAIHLRPDFEPARRQLIASLCQSDRWAEATEVCERGIGLLPDSAALHLQRCELYEHSGDRSSAIISCQQALALDRKLIPAQQALSRLLFETDQLEQAEVSYRHEIQLTPEHFGPYHMLGVVLVRTGRAAEAIKQFERAILLNPGSGASHSSLASAYAELEDNSGTSFALAVANYERAAALETNNAEIHYNLGMLYAREAQLALALASFDRSIQADPRSAKARWARSMLWAPPYSSHADHSLTRSGFAAELSTFETWWRAADADDAIFVGELQPFYLTYQEEGNVELLSQYGRLCAMAMQRWLDHQPAPIFERPKEKRVRLGIVSADIRVHSIWMALIKGWLQSFDRERFEVVIFSLTGRPDGETAFARTKADVFIGGPKRLSHWVSAIREQNCEILLYPAVGLDPMTLRLASLRLAPVQINTWGHPETSGLPTLDYYASAECFEPSGAQDYYSEKLVLMPNLGNRIQPMNLAGGKPDFDELNIDVNRPILICPGTPQKYQPEHDHVFTEIARKLPNAQLLFFSRPESALGKQLQARLCSVFESAGLQCSAHVRFMRWLSFSEFHALLRHADVMLDTIGFSGYNTAVQAMECGLPLVTRDGRFLRGRLASGVLRRMNLSELVVQTKVDYVDLVVKLVTDGEYRAHLRQEIHLRRPALFDDLLAMHEFQGFLERVAVKNAALGAGTSVAR